ncbi:MAG: DUF1553 domain-containing protein [Cytophagales bacterium]|nr:MAG: DUF1553 domain-containing protein [Cytophagales bacterium]
MKNTYKYYQFLSIGVIFFYNTSCNSYKEAEDMILSKTDSIPEIVDYNLHVRPILSDKCFACHGNDKNKLEAGLRLDDFEQATSKIGDNKDHSAIVPGNLAKSELAKRILSHDPELKMPTPKSNLALTDLEKATLLKWIKQGAKYKPLWSFIKPQKHELPKVKNPQWCNNEIDFFVANKLDKEGLKPEKEATKVQLIRRLFFDLTGLPPSPEEIDYFINDKSTNAYEKLVNRIIASKHYGEKMAIDWMDVSRYADSHGYQDDSYRNSYHWRDYVIQSFNENKPFDQFTIEQIAGDLLPNPTQNQLIATGFNRNHAQNQEGGIVEEEFITEYVLDRTNTIGKAFLALTIECTRCHDHKYDPISQKEYYSLSAFFNKGEEAGRIPSFQTPGTTLLIKDDAAVKNIHAINKLISDNEKKVKSLTSLTNNKFEHWLKEPKKENKLNEGMELHYTFDNKQKIKARIKEGDSYKISELIGEHNNTNSKNYFAQIDEKSKLVEGKIGKAIELQGEDPIMLANEQANVGAYEPMTYSFYLKPTISKKGGQVIISRTKDVSNGFPGYDLILNPDSSMSARFISNWPHYAIVVTSFKKIKFNEWNSIAVSYDGSTKAAGVNLYLNGEALKMKVEKDNLFDYKGYKSSYAYNLRFPINNPPIALTKKLLPKHTIFRFGAQDGFLSIPSIEKAAYDDFKFYNRKLSKVESIALSNQEYLTNLLSKTNYTNAEKEELKNYYHVHYNLDLAKNLKILADHRKQKDSIITFLEEVMITKDVFPKNPSYVLNRGAYDALGEPVNADVLNKVLPFPKELPRNRLGLAKWITNSSNPLTPRVIVNRYWQMFFGRGLVASTGDFGNQGELPSHPELLDWLALKFVDTKWDVKSLLKTIVMSSTYKQSSKISEEKYAKDPQNILLSRGARFRMSYEMIRDNALAISGLLNNEIGGPSVFPYQPEGLWEEKTSGRFLTSYTQSHGKDLYRRSIYTFFKRTSPPPNLMTFDASDRTSCVVKKPSTNTPLQSLLVLNDPQLIESAKVIAEKLMKMNTNNIEAKLSFAFKLATSRTPSKSEMELLLKIYNTEYNRFTKNSAEANAFLNIGEYKINNILNKTELAAYTLVVHTILNLDEVINKG